jgi:hypothetical protein
LSGDVNLVSPFDWKEFEMKYRHFALFALLFAGTLVPSALLAQAGKGIPLGKELKGEIAGTAKAFNAGTRVGGAFAGLLHYTELSVSLKAGQNISISATVVGKDRQVMLFFYDPKGVFLDSSPVNTIKSAQLDYEEVSATGTYKIIVASPLVGPFTLRTSDPNKSDPDAKTIRARIEQLEKELAEERSKLKALEEGSNPPLRKGIEKK